VIAGLLPISDVFLGGFAIRSLARRKSDRLLGHRDQAFARSRLDCRLFS
jgi:hypothetical protein